MILFKSNRKLEGREFIEEVYGGIGVVGKVGLVLESKCGIMGLVFGGTVFFKYLVICCGDFGECIYFVFYRFLIIF